MRKVLNGKGILCICLVVWVMLARMLTGCSVEKENQDKVRDLDFQIAVEADIPEELRQIIEEKKAAPFKLTYSNDGGLYIVIGYGEQASGGYSITVNELYLTENSIVVDTELLGPQSGEPTGQEASYPYIVIQTEYLEEPVIFQ